MRLGLPEPLERVLSSTNLIENLFSRVREIGRRVRHWQSGTMVLRWTAAGVLEAERGFRKLTGYRAMRLWSRRYATMILEMVPDRELTKLRKPLI
jgi:putative transposase